MSRPPATREVLGQSGRPRREKWGMRSTLLRPEADVPKSTWFQGRCSQKRLVPLPISPKVSSFTARISRNRARGIRRLEARHSRGPTKSGGILAVERMKRKLKHHIQAPETMSAMLPLPMVGASSCPHPALDPTPIRTYGAPEGVGNPGALSGGGSSSPERSPPNTRERSRSDARIPVG